MDEALSLTKENFGNEVKFYMRAFPPISLTGNSCKLGCKHCNRIYLKHMMHGETEERLLSACKLIRDKGIEGVVLSGGSELDGTVPLYRFSNAMRKIKEMNLTINAHTGPVNREQANEIVDSGLDCAMVDVIGSKETIRNVIGLDFTPQDIENAMLYMRDAGIKNLSPHVIVGLDHCKLEHEWKTIKILKRVRPDNIVIVIVIPTSGTEFEGLNPPPVEEVGSLISEIRMEFPDTDISLSCVRPGGSYRDGLDEIGLRSGVNKIAIPSKTAFDIARDLGYKIEVYRGNRCCSW